MRIVATTTLLVLALVACAPSKDPGAKTPPSTEWKKGDFRVRFQAGPRGEKGKSFSFYEIHHAPNGQQKQCVVKESAHTLGGFDGVTNGEPKNWIRIVQDPGRKALLIEDEIPNDCGPCSNYLWVHLDDAGSLEATYLRLPSKITGPPGGINYEFPKAHSLNGKVLTYGYSVGTTVTQRIDQIEKSESPTPPG